MDMGLSFALIFGATMAVGMSAQAQPAATTPSTVSTVCASRTSSEHLPSIQAPSTAVKPARVSRWSGHRAEKAFLAGARVIEKDEPGAAENPFLRARELDTSNEQYPISAEIARQYVVMQLVQRAKEKWALGSKDTSLTAIEEAMRLDLQSPIITGYLKSLTEDAPARLPEIRATDEASIPIELAPLKRRHTFDLRTDKRSLILQVLNAYGIQAEIDQSVNGQRVHFDADEVDFVDASDLVKLATDTFFVPLDSLHVIVVADTKENRKKYERQVMETIYFPGLSASELTDMENIARNVFGAEHSVMDLSKRTISIRATGPVLGALHETYAELLSGKSELRLEVRLYEIDKTKATNVGVILPTSTTVFNVPSEVNSVLADNASLVNELLASDPSLAGNYPAILTALITSGALSGTVFNSPFAVFGGGLTKTGLTFSGVTANMLLNSTDVRSIDQVQLQILNQEEATIRSGERYPIMTSSFSGLVNNSSSKSQMVPQVQYEDLGLTLKVRPQIESENEVSLNLDLKLASLASSSLNGIPILANRQYSGVVSVSQGDSALVVSEMSKQDSLEITRVPGRGDFPGLSGATNRRDTRDVRELVILITPHIVRLAHEGTVGEMILLPQH